MRRRWRHRKTARIAQSKMDKEPKERSAEKMTKERLKEIIEMLCDADRRGRLTKTELEFCSKITLELAMDARYGYV